jgi:hypothetical protein
VAELRGILPDAVDLAHRHGFLRVAGVQGQGQRCLIITEGTFAQARRLDGQPLVKADGTRIKARNLSGSQGAFIGQGWLGETTHVLLVEGAVGLIEGLAAILLVDSPHAWSILAATSASSRFARDSALLERLRGREVHIMPDTDAAGMDAASSWLADLQSAGVYAIARRCASLDAGPLSPPRGRVAPGAAPSLRRRMLRPPRRGPHARTAARPAPRALAAARPRRAGPLGCSGAGLLRRGRSRRDAPA